MNSYFSTFVTGLQEVVGSVLKRELGDVKILETMIEKFVSFEFL